MTLLLWPAQPEPPPPERVRILKDVPLRPEGAFVLCWMTAARRTRFNFALEHAVATAHSLGRPLVVLEALRVGYRWASDRLHQFVIEGMRDQQVSFARTSVTYYPYVEPEEGAGSGLLQALARQACVVVTDDYPAFFIPRMLDAAARTLDVRLEAIDGNGLLPIRLPGRSFPSAYQFRRYLQRELPEHLERFPVPNPVATEASTRATALPGLPPEALTEVYRRWPPADLSAVDLATLPIDHSVRPSPIRGGAEAGAARLAAFVSQDLARYGEGRDHPDDDRSSGLSPYLHFGQVGAHEIAAAVLDAEGWSPYDLGPSGRGQRAGWWNLSSGAEAFLDQLVTWRELGFNAAAHDPDGYDAYDSIPAWAQRTLEAHTADLRDELYDIEDLAAAQTSDPIWNAAQRQLLSEGRMHNYLRMLWGKRILAWRASPREALDVMVELNNRYALDGRDPNSYSGILWCLGKYDRAWGPERPIYGTVRYMSSENTRRKLRLRDYLARYGATEG